MSKLPKLIILAGLLITLFSVLATSALAEEEEIIPSNPITADTSTGKEVIVPEPAIPYGHSLYKLKLFIETLQEKLTFDELKLLKLRQEHMQNRIDELKYDAVYKNSKHADALLTKIQEKQGQIDSLLQKLTESKAGERIKAKSNDGKILIVPIEDFVENQKRSNYEVLNNLINDPNMPEQAMKGLKNAIDNSMKSQGKESQGKKQELDANMVQGTFPVSQRITDLLPFQRIAFLDPSEKKWYSVIVNKDSVEVIEGQEANLEYLIYPTQRQIDELNGVISRLNKNKSLTGRDAWKISLLWWQVKKEQVN